MYQIELSKQFQRSRKKAIKRGFDVKELDDVVMTLASGEKLDPKYRDHQLQGEYKAFRECHVKPDWLLVYRIFRKKCYLYLFDTGTHADIFGK